MNMREIMNLTERASAVRVTTRYGDEKKVVVHRNPTAMDLHAFFSNKGDLRGLLDVSSGTVFWWAAEEAVHYDVIDALGLDNSKALYVYPESSPEAEYYERNTGRQPHEAVLLYPNLDQKVVLSNRFIKSYMESGMFDPQRY
jgi:hypothetical protein